MDHGAGMRLSPRPGRDLRRSPGDLFVWDGATPIDETRLNSFIEALTAVPDFVVDGTRWWVLLDRSNTPAAAPVVPYR